MLGPIEKEENRNVKDISKLELSYMLPILLFIIWIGVQPNTYLKISENSVKKILVNFENARKYLDFKINEKK